VASSRSTWATFASNAVRFLDGVGALAGSIVGLSGWRRPATAFAAGSLTVLAMAPFFCGRYFFHAAVLVWLIDGSKTQIADGREEASSFWRRPDRAASAGWWFGSAISARAVLD
jgi:apolipoprotein N-acyltransferase